MERMTPTLEQALARMNLGHRTVLLRVVNGETTGNAHGLDTCRRTLARWGAIEEYPALPSGYALTDFGSRLLGALVERELSR